MAPPAYRTSSRLTRLIACACQLGACIAFAFITSAQAQSVDATNLFKPFEFGDKGVFAIGDDPSYASPTFDDSHWIAADAKHNLVQLAPNQHGDVMWQRIHLRVSPNQTGLAIRQVGIGPAFEIFVNGQRVASEGRVHPLLSYTYDTETVIPIPDTDVKTGSLVIALRTDTKAAWFQPSSGPGVFSGVLFLGIETAMQDRVVASFIDDKGFNFLVTLVGIGVALVAFALYTSQRQQKEYLWLALQGLIIAIGLLIGVLHSFKNLPVIFEYAGVLSTLVNFFTVLMVFAFVHQKFPGWQRIYVIFAFTFFAFAWTGEEARILPGTYAEIGRVLFMAIFAFLVPAVLIRSLRRGDRDNAILLIRKLCAKHESRHTYQPPPKAKR